MLLTCANCAKTNRLGGAALDKLVRCGSCKAALTPLAHPIDADAVTFDEVVSQSPLPVLVDFWAEWCGPCRMAAPEVKQTAANMAGRAVVLKVDSDRYPEISARYRVQSIPNFVVLKGGRVVKQQAGVVGHSVMERWLSELS